MHTDSSTYISRFTLVYYDGSRAYIRFLSFFDSITNERQTIVRRDILFDIHQIANTAQRNVCRALHGITKIVDENITAY